MKFGKLILKNILRNKRRTLLTISSLVVSLFLIITLATILPSLREAVKPQVLCASLAGMRFHWGLFCR